MADDKRGFEAQTLTINPIHPRSKVKKETGLKKAQPNTLKNQNASFSKDIILRLIDWLEKE